MTHFADMQITTAPDFAQLRMEFDQYRSAYAASLEAFIGANAGRIKILKWERESITETTDSYSVISITVERDDGQTLELASPLVGASREVEWGAYSDGGAIAGVVAKLQSNGVDDDQMVDAAFAEWAGVRSWIGLTLAEAMFEWVLAQSDLAAVSSIELTEMQVS